MESVSKTIELPQTNENGYYEMRLESIGGLGANLCGKLLGELGAMYLGLNAASFASYGSEKRGSPVKAYVRWCAPEKELRINSPVREPQLLGIFHEAMMGSQPVFAGVSDETKIVINTAKRNWPNQVFTVDCQSLAMKLKSRVNMIMLGALVRASGFIPLDAALQLVSDTVGAKYPEMREANLAGVRAGYEELRPGEGEETLGREEQSQSREPLPLWGYANAPHGGVITRIGSIVSHDVSASREGWMPLFHPDKCIHCGLCDTTCPDMVFQFGEGPKNLGLDYRHCKGCLRCVAVCPVGALTAAREREYPEKPYEMQNRDLLYIPEEFKVVGANSYVTSEAYLDEKRPDGGQR